MIRDPAKREVVVKTIVEVTAAPPAVAGRALALNTGKNPSPGSQQFVELRNLRLAGVQ
jgi:hypothetical protein